MSDQEKRELVQKYEGVCDDCKPFSVLLSGSVAVTMLTVCRICHRSEVLATWDEEDAIKGHIVFRSE